MLDYDLQLFQELQSFRGKKRKKILSGIHFTSSSDKQEIKVKLFFFSWIGQAKLAHGTLCKQKNNNKNTEIICSIHCHTEAFGLVTRLFALQLDKSSLCYFLLKLSTSSDEIPARALQFVLSHQPVGQLSKTKTKPTLTGEKKQVQMVVQEIFCSRNKCG